MPAWYVRSDASVRCPPQRPNVGRATQQAGQLDGVDLSDRVSGVAADVFVRQRAGSNLIAKRPPRP
jgi:hypothetical protein